MWDIDVTSQRSPLFGHAQSEQYTSSMVVQRSFSPAFSNLHEIKKLKGIYHFSTNENREETFLNSSRFLQYDYKLLIVSGDEKECEREIAFLIPRLKVFMC